MSLKMSFPPTFFLRIPGIQPQICFGTTDHCRSVWFDGFKILQFDSMKSLRVRPCVFSIVHGTWCFCFFLSRQEILVWPDGHYDLHNKMPRSRLLWPPHQQDVEIQLCVISTDALKWIIYSKLSVRSNSFFQCIDFPLNTDTWGKGS